MDGPLFLNLEEVLKLHASRIEKYGGDHGVHDLGLLESAIAQPYMGFGGEFFHLDVPAGWTRNTPQDEPSEMTVAALGKGSVYDFRLYAGFQRRPTLRASFTRSSDVIPARGAEAEQAPPGREGLCSTLPHSTGHRHDHPKEQTGNETKGGLAVVEHVFCTGGSANEQ